MQKSLLLIAILIGALCYGQEKIITAAERMDVYLPYLAGKRVGVFANHTSVIGHTNLVDTLTKRGVKIQVIFGPEHGFRGTADAGEKIGNYKDEKTGIPVVSLYGNKHKPSADDLNEVDVMLFDIQDVGVRFYTYISSLQEYIEAAVENKKPLIVLDRPNPNGYYIDGPVLDTNFRSFVGMQPIPVVYGWTIGEYAFALLHKKWLRKNPEHPYVYVDNRPYHNEPSKRPDSLFSLTLILCENYTHSSRYELPVKPSPNLPDMQSVYWYPSTCFFEGTVLSEGRGTTKPFQVFGHPSLSKHLTAFTPRSMPGAANPKLKDQLCYGWDLNSTRSNNKLELKYLLEAYKLFPQKDSFFTRNGNFFNLLAGNDMLIKQVKEGLSEAAIRKSWEPALSAFKKDWQEYLFYKIK